MRVLMVVTLLCVPVFAQNDDCFGWMITPSEVTLLRGERQRFRLVGGDGRPVYGVDWSLEERGVVELLAGDEAEVTAINPGRFVLVGSVGKLELRARGTIIDADQPPAGTVRWSVDPLPGGKTNKIIQSVKVDEDTPDLYVGEVHPEGSITRAMLADGREMWRIPAANSPCAIAQASSSRPLPRGRSVCVAIRPGMAEERVRAIMQDAGISDASYSSSSTEWLIEQPGSECRVTFDPQDRKVVRAKKSLVN